MKTLQDVLGKAQFARSKQYSIRTHYMAWLWLLPYLAWANYHPPHYQIVDAKADIRDLDVGDVDDMEVDVPMAFLDYMKDFKLKKSQPKVDFDSKDFLWKALLSFG